MTADELRTRASSVPKKTFSIESYIKWIYSKLEMSARDGRTSRDTLDYNMNIPIPTGGLLKQIVDRLKEEGYVVENEHDFKKIIIRW